MKLKLSMLLTLFAVFCVLLGVGIGHGIKTISVDHLVHQQVDRELNDYANTKLTVQREKLNSASNKRVKKLKGRISDLEQENEQLKLATQSEKSKSKEQAPTDRSAMEEITVHYQDKYNANLEVIPVKKITTSRAAMSCSRVIKRIYYGSGSYLEFVAFGSAMSFVNDDRVEKAESKIEYKLDDNKRVIYTQNPKLNGVHKNVLVCEKKPHSHNFKNVRLFLCTLRYRP